MIINPKCRKGFTLAEVLITLGIIGVVAAMIIPQLAQNVQDYQFKQAWKKEYSAFAQAYEQVKQDEGGDLSAYFDGVTHDISGPFISKIKDKFFLLKFCGALTDVCGTNPGITILNSDVYKTLSGGYVNYHNFAYSQYILKDGANVYVRWYNPTYSLIWVDVNGYAKGPNTLGKDLFGMTITKDKIMPMGVTGTGVENTCNATSVTCSGVYGFQGTGSCSGAGCSAEALYK